MQTNTIIDPADIEPIIAGTLVLMTHYPEKCCPCVTAKIVGNLQLLNSCPHLSPPLRSLCERLANTWNDRHESLLQLIAVAASEQSPSMLH